MTERDLRIESDDRVGSTGSTPNGPPHRPGTAGKIVLVVIARVGLLFIIAGIATKGLSGALVFLGLALLVLGLTIVFAGRSTVDPEVSIKEPARSFAAGARSQSL